MDLELQYIRKYDNKIKINVYDNRKTAKNTAVFLFFYAISQSKQKNYCSFQTNMIKYPKK